MAPRNLNIILPTGVDVPIPSAVRNEIDAKCPEFFERMQQVGHGPTEAVRALDKHPVELALLGVSG